MASKRKTKRRRQAEIEILMALSKSKDQGVKRKIARLRSKLRGCYKHGYQQGAMMISLEPRD